ncbi:hypothetical protein DVA86_34345 [Streptomyces armeniacus]|uniref:DUF1963 domain-containing protein n=1 Tax=Streptomyces armeniacus TaxID=83291 RepID=A0A345XZ00_9ACTN|nr:hypothetical protein [Streptomyces armeniacus]AXK36866.1 hypothetical protein DVA86_34345 [Streptomyces armeniacus]
MIDDLEQLIARAVAEGYGDIYELTEVADDAPEDLAPYLPRLLAADVVYPGKLYRAADSEVQRGLVAKADTCCQDDADDELRLNHLLVALAQTRGPVAEAAFRRWRDQPPPGADQLHIGPADYMREGGWMLEGDDVRELGGPVSYGLEAEDGPEHSERERCRGCGGPVWTALDLDTADERVAEALAHVGWSGRLRPAFCYGCAAAADTLFIEVRPDGTSRLTDPPEPSTDAPMLEAPTVRMVLGDRSGRRPVGSAVGGQAVWMDDAAYPDCPKCRKPMASIAQIDMQDLTHHVGYHTFFLHTECHLAAMVTQWE